MSAFGGIADMATEPNECPLLTQSGHSASDFAVTHKAALTQGDHRHDHIDLSQGTLSPAKSQHAHAR
jgi:hypothetical protein